LIITIKTLTPELIASYLDFFDNQAFGEGDSNGPCYCTCPMQTSEEIDQMVSEFGGDPKGTIRRHAVSMLSKGNIHGYLAYDGDSAVGWCNCGDLNGYVKNRYQYVPEFARDNTTGKIMSVVCFSIAPEYRSKGVSTSLLERVIADARVEGFEAVEGYAHLQIGRGDFDFKGPTRLFEKFGFVPVVEQDGVVVMRKNL